MLLCSGCLRARAQLPDIRIIDADVFPETITSTQDGTVFAGSVKGVVCRAEPGSAELQLFGEEPALVGIDGMAFSGGGTL